MAVLAENRSGLKFELRAESMSSTPQNKLIRVAFRPAVDQDFDYCRRLYFAEMKWIIEQLHLDREAQDVSFERHWHTGQVRILVLDGVDIGWIQTIAQNSEYFVAQIVVDRSFQRKGIGTEVMKRLISEAARANRVVRLNVVKINPARRLYERLGFQVVHQDDRKLYMELDPARAAARLAD